MLLNQGLYEQIVNALVDKSLEQLSPGLAVVLKELDPGDSHEALAEYLYHVIGATLRGLEPKDRLDRQMDVCNRIIGLLREAQVGDPLDGLEITPAPRQLLSIHRKESAIPRPDTPVSLGCLLTGTRLDPSLVSQLRKEILSSDRIDIICSFIKWSGIRILEEELRVFLLRPGAHLRVITTSYLGATDLKAVDFLQSLPNTHLRVSYDTKRTRLHAKGYIFRRETGFGTSYIGSANLSHAALTDGLEWNVKISQYESPHLWEKVIATFETYWNDAEFALYQGEDQDRLRLKTALDAERFGAGEEGTRVNFDLRPYGFQQEILDQLDAERRVQGRNKHLVVAATGTGKTMIAAFDYRQWCRSIGADEYARPRLLFVAHRQEILNQGLQTFRGVLRDQNFGDLLVAGSQPENHDHLFCSIQSYNSRELWRMPPDHYDYVVVDEFHHSAAPSYRRLLEHVKPRVLLGLTATPERADCLDILRYFDGRMSAEIRLPDAITRKLLCPFQYFGVTDSVDLNGLRWQRGGYLTGDLEQLYLGNDQRASAIAEKVHEKLLDVRTARGLGFCVSIRHAEYMAQQFCQREIPSEALSAESSPEQRRTVQSRLKRREINFIFVVDLYNEGVDIPEIDTVLFLRPTESLTVFLQQLGRGLRFHDEKECLTVLDFIGHAHRSYRFDLRYRALLDDPNRSLQQQIEQGFPHMPAGCSIQLERVARHYVLENIRRNLLQSRVTLVREIKEFAEQREKIPTLGDFLKHYRLDTDDIYRRHISWSRLCVEAGIREPFGDPDEERLTTGLRRIQHINGPVQIRRLLGLLQPGTPLPSENSLDESTRRFLLMLHLSLWGRDHLPSSLVDGLHRIRANPTLSTELAELLSYNLSRVDSVSEEVELPFACPMTLHALYTRDEILAAVGNWTLETQPELREGVRYLPQTKADIFMVTLDKAETDYSPTTMYEDYAISETLFHWQSQSMTHEGDPTGQRYIEHAGQGHTILLCVREHKKVNGLAAPYYFLGPVEYVSHTGSRPMSIVWQLKHPMPARLLRKTARLAVA